MKTFRSLLFYSAILFLFNGCKEETSPPAEELPEIIETEDLTFTNDESYLDSKVEIINSTLSTTATSDVSAANLKSATSGKGTYRIIARVSPIEVNGIPRSASHVRIRNDYAFVSYNTKGADYGGGLQIIDISNDNRPRLKSEAIYDDSDFNALAIADDDKNRDDDDDDGGRNNVDEPIYLAGANRNGALVEKISLDNGKITEEVESLSISGVNTNGIILTDDMLYVTVGGSNTSTSGLYAIDIRDTDNFFSVIDQHNYKRTKDVVAKGTRHGKDMVVLTGGAEASLIFYKVDREGLNKVSDPYPIVPMQTTDGKNTAIFKGNNIYVASSEVGLAIYKKNNPDPDGDWVLPQTFLGGGLTNAVAVDANLVYIANDVTGFFGATKVNKTYPNEAFKFQLDGSANFVSSRSNLIVVANGTDGVLLIKRTGDDDDDDD